MKQIQLRRVVTDACDGPFGSAIKTEHYADEGARVVRLGNIGKGFWKNSDEVFLNIDYWNRLAGHHAQSGDVVMAGLGDGNNKVGRTCVIPDIGPALVKADCYRFRLDVNHVDARFLSAYLSSAAGLFQASSLAEGSTRLRLTLGKALSIQVPLPPLEEQRRIADFLDAETSRIDKLSALQAAILSRLEERASAQRDLALDELGSSGQVIPFRRFIWSVDQGTSPQCEAVPADVGEWGVLKVSCLRPGVFLPGENKRLPDDVTPNAAAEVESGDLLITRANTPLLVGSTAVVRDVRPRLLLSDKIFRVRLSGGILPEFAAEVAAGNKVRSLCGASSNGASQSMANIRFEEVKAWPIPFVSLDEQKKFVATMSSSRSSVESLRKKIVRQLELLNERRQALITAAVTGQFDISTASGRNVTQGV